MSPRSVTEDTKKEVADRVLASFASDLDSLGGDEASSRNEHTPKEDGASPAPRVEWDDDDGSATPVAESAPSAPPAPPSPAEQHAAAGPLTPPQKLENGAAATEGGGDSSSGSPSSGPRTPPAPIPAGLPPTYQTPVTDVDAAAGAAGAAAETEEGSDFEFEPPASPGSHAAPALMPAAPVMPAPPTGESAQMMMRLAALSSAAEIRKWTSKASDAELTLMIRSVRELHSS